MDNKKIDLVYLWVDGDDKNWRTEKEKWMNADPGRKNMSEEITTPARHRNNNELKYSIRSAAKFAPWINHIYIVTSMGQVPKWLNTDHPKITIVKDSEIMPADASPVFNSIALECAIVNIKNLSEFFLYANDDCFFGRRVTKKYFLNRNNNMIVRCFKTQEVYTKSNVTEFEYGENLRYTKRLFKDVFGKYIPIDPSHNIEIYQKSLILGLINHPEIKPHYDRTIRSKFRRFDNMQKIIFSIYSTVFGGAILKDIILPNPQKSFWYHLVHRLNGDFAAAPRYTRNAIKSDFAKIRPPLFCINDTEASTGQDRADNKKFMEAYFPEKSEFEK